MSDMVKDRVVRFFNHAIIDKKVWQTTNIICQTRRAIWIPVTYIAQPQE